jgi:hypothetical protein
MRTTVIAGALAIAITSGVLVSGADIQERLIVKCMRPCDTVVSTVAAAGGDVTATFDNIDAIAVTVPVDHIADLTAAVGAGAVRKDVIVMLPPPDGATDVQGIQAAQPLSAAALDSVAGALPANYNFNNNLTNAAPAHALGLLGQEVIVGVIDSGTAQAAPALSGTVIGGENFVPPMEDPVSSATSRRNDWHGTAVGSMIAAHTNFLFGTTSTLVRSLHAHAPDSVIDCPSTAFPTCPAGASLVPMIGTAPRASIYALKVFPSRGGGASESRIIKAMDRAITLRRHFDAGVPSVPVRGDGTEDNPFEYDALNIRVVNMSLGGSTLNAGRDITDQLTLEMLDAGITLVTSAGNDGFAALTGGSPGTGIGSLTVGASSTPVHERVLRDNQFGFGIGPLYRPFDGVQTADFSARGPTADGRLDPDLSANGVGSYVNVFAAVVGGQLTSCGNPLAPPASCISRILFVAGTSFSSPTAAGAAALLRGAVPSASAAQTRKALILGANPSIVTDGSGRIDQGAGFLDVAAALELLHWDKVKDGLPVNERADDRDDDPDDVGAGGKSVLGNLQKLGIKPVRFVNNRYTANVSNLLPGQVAQFYVPSDMFTDAIVVTITDIVREGPENTLFGDDLFVMGVDAPTSFAVHRIGEAPGGEGVLVAADSTFTIDNPQTGIVRVAIQGDWTNGGRISAKLTLQRTRRLPTLPSAVGVVQQDDLIPYSVTIPAGTTQAVLELFWLQNWGRYPTNDLDMIVIDPADNEYVDPEGNPPGATFSSPERVVISDPMPGTWTILVNGFTIQQGRRGLVGKDVFTLTATADRRRLKIEK